MVTTETTGGQIAKIIFQINFSNFSNQYFC